RLLVRPRPAARTVFGHRGAGSWPPRPHLRRMGSRARRRLPELTGKLSFLGQLDPLAWCDHRWGSSRQRLSEDEKERAFGSKPSGGPLHCLFSIEELGLLRKRTKMNIVVFGANGPTGQLLTKQAVVAGHAVTAVTRHPEAFPLHHEHLQVMGADVFDL